jgi:hypothetical protein
LKKVSSEDLDGDNEDVLLSNYLKRLMEIGWGTRSRTSIQATCPFSNNCKIFKDFLALQEQAQNPLTQNSHSINKPVRLIRIDKGGD